MQGGVELGVDGGGGVGVGFFEESNEFEGCTFGDGLVEGFGRGGDGGGVGEGRRELGLSLGWSFLRWRWCVGVGWGCHMLLLCCRRRDWCGCH